jgi:hypothetical protein
MHSSCGELVEARLETRHNLEKYSWTDDFNALQIQKAQRNWGWGGGGGWPVNHGMYL